VYGGGEGGRGEITFERNRTSISIHGGNHNLHLPGPRPFAVLLGQARFVESYDRILLTIRTSAYQGQFALVEIGAASLRKTQRRRCMKTGVQIWRNTVFAWNRYGTFLSHAAGQFVYETGRMHHTHVSKNEVSLPQFSHIVSVLFGKSATNESP
jgi:hypothetical protein